MCGEKLCELQPMRMEQHGAWELAAAGPQAAAEQRAVFIRICSVLDVDEVIAHAPIHVYLYL